MCRRRCVRGRRRGRWSRRTDGRWRADGRVSGCRQGRDSRHWRRCRGRRGRVGGRGRHEHGGGGQGILGAAACWQEQRPQHHETPHEKGQSPGGVARRRCAVFAGGR